MSKGPTATDGSSDDLQGLCGLEQTEKGKRGEGKLERWADTGT